MSEKCSNNSDNPLTSRRTDGGKNKARRLYKLGQEGSDFDLKKTPKPFFRSLPEFEKCNLSFNCMEEGFVFFCLALKGLLLMN